MYTTSANCILFFFIDVVINARTLHGHVIHFLKSRIKRRVLLPFLPSQRVYPECRMLEIYYFVNDWNLMLSPFLSCYCFIVLQNKTVTACRKGKSIYENE